MRSYGGRDRDTQGTRLHSTLTSFSGFLQQVGFHFFLNFLLTTLGVVRAQKSAMSCESDEELLLSLEEIKKIAVVLILPSETVWSCSCKQHVEVHGSQIIPASNWMLYSECLNRPSRHIISPALCV
ncbi:uncharacterized protein LOC112878293 [Panicum hallii]|uniref:uncharacterized protein LOC112878293 n=1 Tax=Panicum hallii TaxID=206008 RepID=UPI000DF4D3EB|nr:uncharacterized protein LOC112878293 [Panicum hallii]